MKQVEPANLLAQVTLAFVETSGQLPLVSRGAVPWEGVSSSIQSASQS